MIFLEIVTFWTFFRQSHTLAALKAWCHWLSNLHTVSLKNPNLDPQCRELTSKITQAVTSVISSPSSPPDLVHSASHFMVTLTGTVRPPSIWKLKEFTELYSAILQQIRLPDQDQRLGLMKFLAFVCRKSKFFEMVEKSMIYKQNGTQSTHKIWLHNYCINYFQKS